MISRQQFQGLADRLNVVDGGYSHKVAGPGEGTDAKAGYMVGIPGHGIDLPEGSVTGGQLEAHARSNEALLSQPEVYQGGWNGSMPPRASVDVSRRFPTGQRGSRSAAKVLAARGNQEGIGEVDASGGYAGTIANPNYKEGAPQTGRALSIKDAAWAFPQSSGPKAPSSKQSKIRR
jgi:hypothetical protein